MKRLILSACAGLLAVTMAQPSFAADLPRGVYKAPAYVAPYFSWSGFYVGINGGYGWGDSSFVGASPEYDVDGYVLGGTLGYNLQTGVWVWGIEGDFDWSNIEGSAAGFTTENTWLSTVRGRIGYAFDRFLPFITGGVAFGSLDMTPPGGPTVDDIAVGWTLGGGVEYAFGGAWSAKIEYLYVDLGESDYSAATEVEFTTNIVRAGINYRF